ncbi:MAG: hydrogenase [Holophagaceae bacterium]|nr:hydrogenase [Holophagaceae bacterium]
MTQNFAEALNGSAHPLEAIPVLDFEAFQQTILDQASEKVKLACLTADRNRRAFAILADISGKKFKIFRSVFPEAFPSMTPKCRQAHLFEREIAEQWGLLPEGHPWLKPIRFHKLLGSAESGPIWPLEGPGIQNFYEVEGSEVHEVAVGPVHAGIIEPGHFRFQCHGENVFHLEIALGYQHRGIERALEGGPGRLSMKMIETASGDATIGHGLAYLSSIEALMGIQLAEKSVIIRALALELERLANHVGDLGALAQDAGFQPTSAYCGRLRGDFLNLTAEICGNRLGRDLLAVGGVSFDIHTALAQKLLKQLADIEADLVEAVELIWNTSSVASRFEGAGKISKATALELGMVGPAARASGVDLDVRRDFPLAPYDLIPMSIALEETGDIYARARIRAAETQTSIRFVRSAIRALQDMEPSPATPSATEPIKLMPNSIAIGAVEGWRGMIFHMAITGENGQFERFKIVDPSFHNWPGLTLAMRGQGISDFPLCNKSLNLSYCGFDL